MLLALPAAAAAPADPYGPTPAPPGSLITNTTNVGVGGAVVISGNGFAPGTNITINITVVNGFRAIQRDSAPAMGSLLAAGTTRSTAAVQGFAALSVTADANGAFSTTVTLTQAGTNVITATGLDPNGNLRTLSTTVFVGGAGSGAGGGTGAGSGAGSGSGAGGGNASGAGGLPNTGADLKLPVILGGILVLLGGGALVAGRKRKQHADVAA
ncbi:MAG TPA: LPXTG cell wall anchor domain-containing protein [Mycobacteriales bacterium]|nr:LPXTG cell wall anchor domain-containing protein [Mycobacteriales bacterium]